MIVVLSPSKTLDMDSVECDYTVTQPHFLEDSRELVGLMRTYSKEQIGELMDVSDKLATLNMKRFEDWSLPFTTDNSKPAFFAFKGDVYEGLSAETLSGGDLTFAQNHVRMLSGLYGILRPLDLIQAYRLEMGRSVENERGKNLYEFWGSKITTRINADEQEVLVNLASIEYFKSVKKRELTAEIVTPVFKDEKNGKLKVISFYAKKARGLMTRYIIENRITDVEQLKAFDWEGYSYQEELSIKKGELVFTRPESK